jgi:hypothetical protein
MGRIKGIRVWTVFFIIFIVGGLPFFILIHNISPTEEFSGKKYGSPDKPIVLEFQAGSRHDYWKITFRTLRYNMNDYMVRIYKMDRCNYEWYLENGVPYEYEYLPEDQVSTLKLQPEYKTYCEDDDMVYIVWDVQDGTVIADIDSLKVYFYMIKPLYGYIFGNLGFYGLILVAIIFRSKRPSRATLKANKLIQQHSRHNNKKKFCALCGNKIRKNIEYCPYCGKIYTIPDLDRIKRN